MIYYIIIYLIGFVIAYYILRKADRNDTTIPYTWGDVIMNFITSLFSWITVFIVFIAIYYVIKLPNTPKPPKWL